MVLTCSFLLGCWRLEEFVIVRPSGKRVHPYGTDANGVLLYTHDGWVSAVLSAQDRPAAETRSLENAQLAGDADKVAAFDTYMSYAGRYTVRGSTIVHEIVTSLAPGLLGAKMLREAQVNESGLTLTYQVEGRSGTSNYILRWVRPK